MRRQGHLVSFFFNSASMYPSFFPVVTSHSIAMIVLRFPKRAASSVPMADAGYTRVTQGMWSRRGETRVYALCAVRRLDAPGYVVGMSAPRLCVSNASCGGG